MTDLVRGAYERVDLAAGAAHVELGGLADACGIIVAGAFGRPAGSPAGPAREPAHV